MSHQAELRCPSYERPPVVETVVGVQFEPLSAFRNAHLGLFWKELDANEWRDLGDVPTLDPEFERFGTKLTWHPGVRFQLTQEIASRLQIKKKTGDRMIQVQNGRFHLNWIGAGGADYPRYTTVKAEFQQLLDTFTRFLESNNLGEFQPNQWEITYINQIKKGTVWNSPGDWSFFRLLQADATTRCQLSMESFSGEWHFSIPDERGRLHLHWKHGLVPIKDKDPDEAIWLTFTARGPIADSNKSEQIIRGLDLGHDSVVCTFRDLMSEDANRYWGLKND